jgi:pyridinium-3,5-bisthiocarboxylic acid mononucleotide nickel chelatase
MTTVAWFHCFSGVAGDMALGALLDAGADIDVVKASLKHLPITGWSLAKERTQRNGIGATRALVEVKDTTHERSFADIRTLLADAQLPTRVHERSLTAFTALAEVEAAIHNTSVDDIHFHEVGSLDAIVDVIGVCAALEDLGVDAVYCSPIAQGLGTVRADHGILPNPVPAVVGLLAQANAPTYGLELPMELTTPTGAALMTTLATAFGPIPAMTVKCVGYGAGGRTMAERPNLVQVIIGQQTPANIAGTAAVELAANVDDVTGEVLAYAITSLLEAGAHDAWATPIVMKKGRPAHTLHALCDPAKAAEIREVLIKESGTLGVRVTTAERWPQAREEGTVTVEGHVIRIKRSANRVKVEQDDALAAAAATGRSLRDVLFEAEAAGRAPR